MSHYGLFEDECPEVIVETCPVPHDDSQPYPHHHAPLPALSSSSSLGSSLSAIADTRGERRERGIVGNGGEVQIAGIPGYLWHVIFEVLKNSFRAIVEKYEIGSYPPVIIRISPPFPSLSPETSGSDAFSSDGLRPATATGSATGTGTGTGTIKETSTKRQRGKKITIQISDLGGGIPAHVLPLVWRYMYTTAPQDSDTCLSSNSPFASPTSFLPGSGSGSGGEFEKSIMAGFGYGLPISRLYARYCGGELWLESKEGVGTDCYFTIVDFSDPPV